MKKNNNKQVVFYCLAWLIAIFSTEIAALESDARQPITIDSNTATYNDANATSTYTGNVISAQGSIRVNSDKLVVYLKDGEAERLVFTGKPARFKQTPNKGGEDIVGEALTGEYYPKQNLLVLKDQAVVIQGNATYASKYIQYDIKNSTVKAGEKASDSKRVHVILKPKTAK